MKILEKDTQDVRHDYDGAWKAILDKFFQPFVQLCLPEVYAEIDWSRGYISLDKELEAFYPQSHTGKRIADKLMKVWRHSGEEFWVLIHFEIQAQKDKNFQERIWVGHYRLFDLYKKPILSVAVLSDINADWRPAHYEHQLWNCKLRLDYVVIKLLDYERPEMLWQMESNPLMILIQAHLQSLRARSNGQNRLDRKLAITRVLYERGLSKQEILDLFRFIDWLMVLPGPLMLRYRQELEQLEERTNMHYVTSIERYYDKKYSEKWAKKGMKEGREKGIKEGIKEGMKEGELKMLQLLLTTRFGHLPIEYEQKLKGADAEQLLKWAQQILVVESLESLFAE